MMLDNAALSDAVLHQRSLSSANLALECRGLRLTTAEEYAVYTAANAAAMREYYNRR